MRDKLGVYVLLRASKKSGKIDKVLTACGYAQLQLWALNNTTSSKVCLVFERETGYLWFATQGTKNGFPEVKKAKDEPLAFCEDYDIPLEYIQSITDDRFDKED